MEPIRTMSEIERAWLAAVIDGEGSIGIYLSSKKDPSQGRAIFIQAANTFRPFVDRIHEVVGAGSITAREYRSKLGNEHREKTIFQFGLKGSRRGMEVLEQILPYLIVKKEKAEAILKELREKPFGRWANATPESRARMAEMTRQSWKDPIVRQKRIDGLKH